MLRAIVLNCLMSLLYAIHLTLLQCYTHRAKEDRKVTWGCEGNLNFSGWVIIWVGTFADVFLEVVNAFFCVFLNSGHKRSKDATLSIQFPYDKQVFFNELPINLV